MDSGTKIFTPQRSFVMKSTKHFLLAAISIALALTFSACDSGSGGGNTCSGKQYDQSKYGCVNDELVGTCNGSYYNPEYERCNNGQVQDGAEITFPPSSGGNGGGSGNSSCEIQGYKTVKIGTQTFMAENLNCAVEGSRCYGDNPANCIKYGRLYNWEMARSVCPSGWHLPTSADWDKLFRFVDGTSGTYSPYESSTAGKKLKAKSGWNENGNGTDDYNFAALPGGYYDSNFGDFGFGGDIGYWWSSSEDDAYTADLWLVRYDDTYIDRKYWEKKNLYSVRCVQN
jgi:uncharacterized protein (TIGR02145 family)